MTSDKSHVRGARLAALSLLALGAAVPAAASAQFVPGGEFSARTRNFNNLTSFQISDICPDHLSEECSELLDQYASSASGLPPVTPASVYPSKITVSPNAFVAGAKITDVNVTIKNLSHDYLDDVDLLLVAPDGKYVMLASNVSAAGGNLPDGTPTGIAANNLNWKFDDAARLPLPNSNSNEGRASTRPTTNTPSGPVPNPLYSVVYSEWQNVWTDSTLRTFKPSDYDNGGDNDVFPAPAPQGLVTPGSAVTHSASAAPVVTGGTPLSVFNGSSPVGEWKLYVADDFYWFDGSLEGWSLEITAK